MKKLFTIIFVAVLLLTACGPSAEKLFEKGLNYYDQENYVEAFNCFTKSADKGHAEAMYYVGLMYFFGAGVVIEDVDEGIRWIEKSATNGFGRAQNDLAFVYANDDFIEHDYDKAAYWAKQALTYEEYPESLDVLATLYFYGESVPQDYYKAFGYCSKLYKYDSFQQEAAEMLFVMYINGWGVQQNDDTALDYLVIAENCSKTEAMSIMARAFYVGRYDLIFDVPEDYSKAAKWYRKAADNGDSDAQLMMSILYKNGQGVNKNMSESIKWLKKSANNGNMEAQEKLADAYISGEGMEADYNKAKYWWKKAADQGSEKAKKYLEFAEEVETIMADALNRYSVGPNKIVSFAKGNLQYQPSTKKWRFAAHQWDYIGDANKNISSTYSGWIDLFGWGTGKNPTKTGMDGKEYTPFNDWGNNNITNGDGKQWRTLTKDEWVYLMEKRRTDSGIRFALAKVNGVPGIVLLPDGWQRSYYTLNSVNDLGSNYESNNISKNDWTNKFEKNGAIFLPTGGTRIGTNIQSLGVAAQYWSSTPRNDYDAYSLWTAGALGGTEGVPNRMIACSVRLVCNY